ncbi:MAG: hypothetical protein JSV92_02630 [archaeon]|nr:MAG: hypothetical protein JSV92_02630 [archaeon]
MMRRIFCIMLCILLVSPSVLAVEINVRVRDKIGGQIEYFELEKNVDSVQRFVIQWYNSESVSCRSRMEYRIGKGGGKYETVWSDEREMPVGVSRHFEAYWLPEEKGNYSTVLVIHHCHDAIKSEAFNFSVESVPRSEETIGIEARNLPGKKIEVMLDSDTDVEDLIVIPTNYPAGWIFSSKRLENLEAGEGAKLVLDYEPSVWMEEKVDLQAVSLDGRYSSEKISFKLREEKYFWDENGYSIFIVVLILLILSSMANIYAFSRKRK